MRTQRIKVLEAVRELRDSIHLNQEEMAQKMNISQSAYARFESGKSKTDLETLEKFAECFNMSIIDILYYPDESPKDNGNRELKAQLTIELKAEKKDQVLKLVFGDNNLEILNK